MDDTRDFAKLSDPELIEERRRVRHEFERLPAGHAERFTLEMRFDAMTTELDDRAAAAWGETPRSEQQA
jgi:hypothetical protein